MSDNQERKSQLSEAERYSLIEEAISNRYTYQEVLELERKDGNFSNETEIDRVAFKKDVERVLSSPRYVVCSDFDDIHGYLPILERMGYSVSEDTIPHESAHWNQFIEEAITPIIGFYFVSLDGLNFRKALQIFTAPREVPENMSDLEFLEAMKRVLAAPEKLSPSDLRMLGKNQE